MKPDFGAYLNTPERGRPCFRCGSPDCRMSVYVHALVWDCGDYATLPPIHRRKADLEKCEVCRRG